MPQQAQPKKIRELETLLHCRRQQLIGMAASRGGTLKIDDAYERVCSSTIAEIDTDTIVQDYYHIIPTGEKREYGELLLRKLHDDYEIMMENNIAKGECHELPLVLERDATLPPMEIKGPTTYGGDQIEDVIDLDRKENCMYQVPENTSRLSRRRRLHREVSPTRPSGRVFELLSNSSTLLVGVNPGQLGVALRQRRAPGRGATAPAADRRRRRRRSPSHRIWAGHSLRG
jgi:hypothetical protein